MGVELRIGNAVDRTTGRVDELRPHHVSGRAIHILVTATDTGQHFSFDGIHGLIDRLPKCVQDALIAAQGIEQRYTLRHAEGKVVPDCTIGSRQHRERLPGHGVEVIAKPFK